MCCVSFFGGKLHEITRAQVIARLIRSFFTREVPQVQCSAPSIFCALARVQAGLSGLSSSTGMRLLFLVSLCVREQKVEGTERRVVELCLGGSVCCGVLLGCCDGLL